MNTITFEIGDIAHCPYNNYTGIIIEFKKANGIDYIRLHDPNKPAAHTCDAQLRTDSVNGLHPLYLQLICKKEDYEAISQKQVFGHPSNPKQPVRQYEPVS